MKSNDFEIKCRHLINNVCSKGIKTWCENCKTMRYSEYEPEKEIIADLTPYFTEKLKNDGSIVGAYITVNENEETKAIEVKFKEGLQQDVKNIILRIIGNNLLDMCVETEERNEQDGFLELMDGMQLKEWKE